MWKKRSSPLFYAKSESLQSCSFNSPFWSTGVYWCIWFILWKDYLASKILFSFSFCRTTKLFGSLNCASELSKKKKKPRDCSICFAVFLMQAVITLWHCSSQRTSCILKKSSMHRFILYVFVPPQLMCNIVGVKIVSYKFSPRVFLLVCCVLMPKWDFCVRTCRLVEIAWRAGSQLGAVLVQGCWRLS